MSELRLKSTKWTKEGVRGPKSPVSHQIPDHANAIRDWENRPGIFPWSRPLNPRSENRTRDQVLLARQLTADRHFGKTRSVLQIPDQVIRPRVPYSGFLEPNTSFDKAFEFWSRKQRFGERK
ncbi:unnamed protein product [Linum trigynum]|uniref:Uncharacterized protein n=1 Tax=Linum trigynum TaxID=586398 RepID=A0AAV2CM32_9ROSI